MAITFPGLGGLSVRRDFNIGISFMILLQVLLWLPVNGVFNLISVLSLTEIVFSSVLY